MLRVVPSFFAIKLWGVLVMFGAIVVLFLVPWLDKSPVKSYRYRGKLSWVMLAIFVISFLWLGKIGAGPGTDPVETILGRVLTFLYFVFFITLPRSEEHTSELQSLMRTSYAVCCLKQKTTSTHPQ